MSTIYFYRLANSIVLLRHFKQYEIMSEHRSEELSFKHFYIFNDSYGKIEGEEEQKIMYYFPSNTNSDEKMKNVGLSEAIIQFTETFSQQPCESLHTEQTRHYYYKPEPHFCMVMVVNVPSSSGVEGRSYQGELVQDTVCRAVLRQAYLVFRLFHNTFTSHLRPAKADPDPDPTPLKKTLETFFNKYVSTLKLDQCDIMDVFQGVQFLPLDKQTFLHIQCFINLLEASFPVVHFTALLYNNRLIWSGLEPEDMQVVFHYLVRTLLPRHSEPETGPALSSYGRFLTGPENVHSNNNNVGQVPKLFLHHGRSAPAAFHIAVYNTANCTVCLFIPESEQLTMDMFRKWDTFFGPRITRLVAEICAYTSKQSCSTAAPADSISRFVYFNRMNLATKSTVHRSNGSANSIVSPQVLRILADIHSQHSRSPEVVTGGSAETIVKTTTDCWVVGKLSNAREFYVIIQQKNANLIEINDEVKRICDNELKSIFFHV